jgi:coenzyme F420-reducing hydrogenase beta subunit
MMRRGTDKLVVACAVLCVLCAITVAVLAATVLDTHAATQQIQDERAANIRRNCEDVNDRHDETIMRLRALVESMPAGARRSRAEQGMAGSVALIDALAPKRDCDRLVRQQVPSK